MTVAIGIDVGGTAIKGALVDTDRGVLAAARAVAPTPQPALPHAVAEAVAQMCGGFDVADAPVGVAVPAVVTHGIVRTAANIDDTWIGADASVLFEQALGRPARLLNDADAAGVAEARFGAARDVPGVVMVVTLGTGIGSALLVDGHLAPNTELGHLERAGEDMCPWACAAAKGRDRLSWAAWAERLQIYFSRAEELLWPDLFVVGGAISTEASHFLPRLRLQTPVVSAKLGNDSGTIGAAYAACQKALSRQ